MALHLKDGRDYQQPWSLRETQDITNGINIYMKITKTITLAFIGTLLAFNANALTVLGNVEIGSTDFQKYANYLKDRCKTVKQYVRHDDIIGLDMPTIEVDGSCLKLDDFSFVGASSINGKIELVYMNHRSQKTTKTFNKYYKVISQKHGETEILQSKEEKILAATWRINGSEITEFCNPTECTIGYYSPKYKSLIKPSETIQDMF